MNPLRPTVREFVGLAFAEVGCKIEWRGEGVQEEGLDARTGQVLVRVDPRYFRPTEVELLIGDAGKARQALGWQPEIPFTQMVSDMVAADLAHARQEASHAGR